LILTHSIGFSEALRQRICYYRGGMSETQWNRRQVIAAAGLALGTRWSTAASSAAARCLVYDYEGQPLAAETMRRFHLCDLKMRPFTREPKITAGNSVHSSG